MQLTQANFQNLFLHFQICLTMRKCEIFFVSLLLLSTVNGARRGIRIQESTSVKVNLDGLLDI